MEPGHALPCSQEHNTGLYPEPNKSNQHPNTLFIWSLILILSYHLRLDLGSGIFPLGFRTNILYAFLISLVRAVYPANLIVLDLITVIKFRCCSTLH